MRVPRAAAVGMILVTMAVRCRSLQIASSVGSKILPRSAAPLHRQVSERSFAFGIVQSDGRPAHPRSLLSSPLTRYGHATSGSEESNGESDTSAGSVDPTWTYTPYKAPPPSRGQRRKGPGTTSTRRFSTNDNFRVPDKITVPESKVEMSFVRSSGAGGQNVNKLSTKVEVRLRLADATFIPQEVRDRIKTNHAHRMNKDGYVIVTSQEYRTQAQNRKDAMSKLEDIILKSYPRPKVRKVRTGVSKKAKERKKENKQKRSQVKANRKQVDF